MVEQREIIETMVQLADVLTLAYPESETAQRVCVTRDELSRSQGVAFTGAYQQFLNRASTVKFSEGLEFTAKEQALWAQAKSFQQLGNNLWAAGV